MGPLRKNGYHPIRGTGALPAPGSCSPEVPCTFIPTLVVGAVAPPAPHLGPSAGPLAEAATSCQPPAPCQPAWPAPTWQPQDGEVAPALGEAGAFSDTGAPQALVVEDGRHRVVVQILGAPLVHAGGCNDARNADQ